MLMTTMSTAMVNMVLATTGTNTITPMAMASRKASMRVDTVTTAATSTVDGEVMQKERNTDHITDLHTMTATVKDTTAMTTTELPSTLRTRSFSSCTKVNNKVSFSIFF
ncbi:hypothetical protein OSTOST_04566 [Ostertagia ostertagi]